MVKIIESLVEILKEKNPSEKYKLQGEEHEYEEYRLCEFCEGEGQYESILNIPSLGLKKGDMRPCNGCGGVGVQYFYLIGKKWGPIPGLAKVDNIFGEEDWKRKKDLLDYQLARYGFEKE